MTTSLVGSPTVATVSSYFKLQKLVEHQVKVAVCLSCTPSFTLLLFWDPFVTVMTGPTVALWQDNDISGNSHDVNHLCLSLL